MVGPNYARPAVEQPAHFKSQVAGDPAPAIAREWWQLYGDPELDRLVASQPDLGDRPDFDFDYDE